MQYALMIYADPGYAEVLLDSLVHEINALRGVLGEPEAVVSAESCATAAPLTMKKVPGSAWNEEAAVRSVLKSCAQARRPRSVKMPFCNA